jgi:hypothetical protein
MSVLKSKRSLSKLEFYHNARKMRKDFTDFLRRDFGIHSRKNAKNINTALPEDYYAEDMGEFAKNIKILLRNLMWNITGGNSIYPATIADLEQRRHYQNAAIINCEQLHQELLFCEDTLPVQVSQLVQYVESIEFEIKLLKGWRKSNNKFEDFIKKKEADKAGKDNITGK